MNFLIKNKPLNFSLKMVFVLIISLFAMSCNNQNKEKEYFTISGKIENHTVDSLYIFNFGEIKKTIQINKDGSFLDTIKIDKPGMFFLNHETGQYRMFFRNGYNVGLSWDAKNLKETIKFSGENSNIFNYFRDNFYNYTSEFSSNLDYYHTLNKNDFQDHLDNYLKERLLPMPKNDSIFVSFYTDLIADKERYNKDYDDAQYFLTVLNKGKESPKFYDYENYDESKVSLNDLKGKYVFIDIWATWCTPCINEIPHLEELQKKYENKNIIFLSISIDDKKNKDKWKKMIKEKNLKGVQLIADNKAESEFMQSYKVESIPRFIILDSEGKIISSNAPYPSEVEKISNLLDKLNL
ncbi:redoxin family protein [Cellulophaga fucicola]|uniref:TlpA family protein disulfide reductase n=1 Tax=Cellulophaga fucicola TaxID=76595 RepID=UPI003EBEC51C